MRPFIKLILTIVTFVVVCTPVQAGDHPEAHFGKYGIEHHQTLAGYQKYIGKTVMYFTEYTPSYADKQSSFAYADKFEVPFVITKISGSDTRMVFHMVEKGGKKKLKMVINNKDEYYSYGNYTYCISDGYNKYTVPLALVDELDKTRAECVGKVISNKYEIVDFRMSHIEKKGYPVPCYVVKDIENNRLFPIKYDADINMLGHVFTHPKVKATYEIIELCEVEHEWRSTKVEGYRVKNSVTGQIKSIPASSAMQDCFKDDLSGRYVATLTKVERPTDSSDRYGTTEIIQDNGVTKYSYVDEYIDIIIFATNSQFKFMLKNVSQTSIKVIWNEAVFVDSDGSTSKIMHVGTKYSQREGDQPATTIIKGAKIDDIAAPTKNVRYSDVLKEWVSDSMFPSGPALKVEPIRLMLPIQVRDVINEYIFVFDVNYEYNYPDRLN